MCVCVCVCVLLLVANLGTLHVKDESAARVVLLSPTWGM